MEVMNAMKELSLKNAFVTILIALNGNKFGSAFSPIQNKDVENVKTKKWKN